MLRKTEVLAVAAVVLALALAAGLAAIPAAAAVPLPQAVALRAPAPVTIDGDPADWLFAKANAIVLDTAEQLTPGYENPATWHGPSDLSAIAYVAYDDDNLYIAFDVRDDAVIQQFSGTSIYNGDGPELYLDTDPEAGASAYTPSAWQFGFTPGTDAKAPSWVLYEQISGRVLDPSAVKVAAHRTADGYIFEAAISLAALAFHPSAGQKAGFDLAVNDVDSFEATATENQIILSGSGDGWQTPAVFVTLLFQ